MVEAVIFDMDGTILNTLYDLTESANFASVSLGYETHTENEIRSFVGNGILELAKRALPQTCDIAEIYQWIEIFKNHYIERMYDNTKPYDGITDLLKTLKSKGIKTAVVSNKFDGAVKELTERYFEGYIDTAVGQSSVIPPKPAPEGTLKAIEDLDVKNAVFVGDSDVDIYTAQNAKLISIGVTWGFRNKENLKGANYIVNTPNELLNIILSL